MREGRRSRGGGVFFVTLLSVLLIFVAFQPSFTSAIDLLNFHDLSGENNKENAIKENENNGTIICRIVSDGVECNGETYSKQEEDQPPSTQFFIDLGVSCGLTLIAGMMSGLTMGLMSIDLMNLQILANRGTPSQQVYAKRIMPLVKRHHLLLVTLLVCNAAAMEALPIFLDRLVGPIIAIIVSVTCILFFGEIIPQAICTRFGLAIGGHLFWFVWILVVITFPVSWPISLLLDFVLGDSHSTYFRRAELKELVHLHGKGPQKIAINGEPTEKDLEAQPHDALSADEVTIIHGALDMKLKTVRDALTPLDDVFMLEMHEKMGSATMDRLLEEGYSRVPIYRKNRQNILGMLIVKTLIKLNPADNVPISDIDTVRLPVVNSDLPLYEVLNLFQHGHSHMAVVLDSKDHLTVLGIITLEDVIEELIQEEITDETDLTARHQPPTIPIVSSSYQGSLYVPTNPMRSERRIERQHKVGSLLRGESFMRMSTSGIHLLRSRDRSENRPLIRTTDSQNSKEGEEDEEEEDGYE